MRLVNLRLSEGESGRRMDCNCFWYWFAMSRSSDTATVELRPVGGRPCKKSRLGRASEETWGTEGLEIRKN